MPKRLKVKDALAILSKADPEAILVVPGSDHSYRAAGLQITTAVVYPDGQIDEDHGEDNMDEDGKSVPAILIE